MPTDADRGQSIQIGAVLLFGILIVFLASWQAMVVPQENEDVEFNHNLQVQNDVQELRNAIVSAGDGSGHAAVDVRLGTAYPTRILFVNPGPPSGSLRTVGTASDAVNLSLENVTAPGDAGDFWDGSDRDYTTGGVVYTPNYNIYEEAPATTYENSVLYNDFGGRNLTVAGQRLVDGNSITLVTLNGSLSEARADATTVDVRPVTASRSRLGVVNATSSEPVTIGIPTALSAANWRTLLEDQNVTNGGHVKSVNRGADIPGTDLHIVKIRMKTGSTYRLSLARVGVGTGVNTSVSTAYLTKTSGNGSVVPEGATINLEVRVWDRFNNPVGGVSVDANTSRSNSSVNVSDVSDDEGRIELQYQADPDIDGGAVTDEVNVSFTVRPSAATGNFNPETAPNVTFDLTVDNTDRSGTGGVGGDTTGPEISNVDTDATSTSGEDVSQGTVLTLSAVASDIGLGGSDVIAAEWWSNKTNPGGSAGNGFSMTAIDGQFDQAEEGIQEGSVDTSSWDTGMHNITIRARDANDNWGPGGVYLINITTGGGGGAIPSADRVSLVTSNKFDSNTDGTNESVSFTLENTGSDTVTIANITVDSAANGNVAQIGNGSVVGGKNNNYKDDGPELRGNQTGALLDVGSPFGLGTTQSLGTNSQIAAGDKIGYTLAEFRDSSGGGNEVDPGSSVTVTFGFADGSEKQVTMDL